MAKPKGYILAELDVTDAAYFHGEYMPRVRPVLDQYGAKFLIATNDPEVLEGGRVVKRVVFIEFESLARARLHPGGRGRVQAGCHAPRLQRVRPRTCIDHKQHRRRGLCVNPRWL